MGDSVETAALKDLNVTVDDTSGMIKALLLKTLEIQNEVKELKASATAPRVPVMSALPGYVPDAPEPLAMAVL